MHRLFSQPQTLRSFFLEHGQRLVYDKQQVFIRADDPQPWAYMLEEGIIELTFSLDDDTKRMLGYLGPNAVFGQNRSFFDLDNHDGGDLEFTTITGCTLYRMHKDVFLKQLQANVALTWDYLALTSWYRIMLTDYIAYIGENKIHSRLIRWLLFMAKYYSQPVGRGCRIEIPLTQDTIATFLHVSRESVSKGLRALVRGGHISISKKQITIKDIAALKALLNS